MWTSSHRLPECSHNVVAGLPQNERFKPLKSHRLVLLLYSVVTLTRPNLVWEGVLLHEYQEILGGKVFWGPSWRLATTWSHRATCYVLSECMMGNLSVASDQNLSKVCLKKNQIKENVSTSTYN